MNTPYSLIAKKGIQFLCCDSIELPEQIKTEVVQDPDLARQGIAKVTVTVLAKVIDTK